MGCFGCFERQAVEDESQTELREQQKGSTEEQRPATAPAAASKRIVESPVPATSSHESTATPTLQKKDGIAAQPVSRTGSGSTGSTGKGMIATGRRSTGGGVINSESENGGALVLQESLAPSTSNSMNSATNQRDNKAQGEREREGEEGRAEGENQGLQGRRTSSRDSVANGGGSGVTVSVSGSGSVEEKALQPHEPIPQPSTLAPIRDQSGAPIAATTFSFKELERATKNFSPHNFVGEGGFGRVYKGKLESTGQMVAVKQLDRNGLQGNREFLVEVLMLSLLHHSNLVQLIGYCADGDQRLLVYEFMANGALEDHLHDLPEGKECLDWNMRMKVAAGAARGLEYLHDKASPPVIYRDFKSSNILLDANWHPKLSDFGLAKLGPVGDKTHVSTRVMGTYGYCAPEYAMTGQLTVKSDVYSFGVVLLELITGRKAIDNTRPNGEHNLVAWARPLFKDRRKFPAMADPLLGGKYPMRGLYQALAVAAMCLQEQASQRPMIHDVVTALSYLAAQQYDPNNPPPQRFSPQHELGRDRRGSRSPQVRGVTGASPRASPAHNHRMRGTSPKDSPGLGPLGQTSSSKGYRERESPGRSGLGSGKSTPNHPLSSVKGGNVENVKPVNGGGQGLGNEG